ncbi:MAG: ABC transporter permease, partial [Clostridium sp.]|nr:ABC transporter permease [Clostridium sp.]
MYGRLVLRNARRSIKDYLIYMVTLTLCVMLFYAFLSISSRYYDPPIGSEYNIEMLSGGMKTAVCFITGLLIFLIQYVNRYMLLRKKKEFAVELVMGMERETLARLFLGETFLMGAVSLVCGIIMGIFLAQVISAMLLTMYGAKFQISWTLYPDTVLLTVFFFFSCLIVVGFFHRRAICRLKIIEMLQADKMNEDSHKKDGWMDVLTFLFFGFLLFMAYTGVGNMSQAYDSRLSPVVKCILLGNVICPVGNLALGLIWFFRRGRWPFRNLLKALMVMELPLVAAAAGVPFIHSSTKVLFAVSEDVLEKYMIFLIFHIIYSVFLMFYLLGGALENIRKKSILFTYREENLFLLGQLITKLKTATKSMSLICIAVVLSVNLFLATPVVIGWLFGYLDARAVYDIQMYSQYQKTHSIDEVSGVNYAAVDDFLETNQVDIQWKHSVDFYLTRREEFTNRTVADFPVLAISLSDYNELRAASQLEPIRLQADEFVTQWKSIATDDESEEFAAGHQSLHTDGGRLRIAETGIIEEDLGEYLYHKYTNVIYVVPDEICKSLLPVNYHSYMKTE